jgi:hypothetical protein
VPFSTVSFQKLISRADIDPIIMEDDQDSNDNRPLAEVTKGKGKKTAQESADSPGGDLFPGHPWGSKSHFPEAQGQCLTRWR